MAAATKDAVLGSAVDLAREAAVEVAENPDHVGEHLGMVVEGDRLVAHRFACTAPGYRSWHWDVTLARVPRGRAATVCEALLLPGDGAVLAPPWVPWAERLRPGDVGPGDVLPFAPDDPRLEPGYTPTGDEDVDRVAIEELALARVRVLSPRGKDEAADRWYAGLRGPTAPAALASAAPCGSCGFMVRLIGSLGTVFGVCTNEWSPDDGKVVSLDHGCGAHSETDVEPQPSEWPAPAPSLEELDVEIMSRSTRVGAPATASAAQTRPPVGTATQPDAGLDPAAGAQGEDDGDVEPDPDAATRGAEQPEAEPAVADSARADASVDGPTGTDGQASATGSSDLTRGEVEGSVPPADAAPEATAEQAADAQLAVDAEPDPDAALEPGADPRSAAPDDAAPDDAAPDDAAPDDVPQQPEADDQSER